MKRKHLILGVAAVLAAGGLWFARTTWRADAFRKSSMDIGLETPDGPPKPGPMPNRPGRLAPPNPIRRFTDFTPEQRVEFARKGHGPGG